jgi:hypothetical protein
MGVLHSTHPMQQASSKWISQAPSGVDAVIHAWHVLSTFLTLKIQYILIVEGPSFIMLFNACCIRRIIISTHTTYEQ